MRNSRGEAFQITDDFQQIIGDSLQYDRPESRLWSAVIERGLMDYTHYWVKSRTKALRSDEMQKFKEVHYWLFLDDTSRNSLSNILDFLFIDSDPLIAAIRKVAEVDPERFWHDGRKKSFPRKFNGVSIKKMAKPVDGIAMLGDHTK